jgi:hypothetical protein
VYKSLQAKFPSFFSDNLRKSILREPSCSLPTDGQTDRQKDRQAYMKKLIPLFAIFQTRLKAVKMTANAKDKNKWSISPFFHAPSWRFYRDIFSYTLFIIWPKWKKGVMTDFK